MNTQPVPVWTLFSNARRDKGLRMKQVAHDTGLSVHTVFNSEAGLLATRPTFKLARYYGIDGRVLMASVLRVIDTE
jgi:DNA-binding XRE family transcriptional regulator